MVDMPSTGDTVFLQIQNSKKPDQLISLVLADSESNFVTKGLKSLFDVDEIEIERNDFLVAMEEYTMVLSFLLETMSAALDFNLPYSYLEQFEYKGQNYSLLKKNGKRILTRANLTR